MAHLYGPVPNGPTHGKIGVIVATEPRGPLANLIYCSTDQPLFKVPRNLYKEDVVGQGSSTLRYKQPLAIGVQVEFGLDDNRRDMVLWMMKAPNYLPIDSRSGDSPRMEVIAAVTAFGDGTGELGLWSPRYKYIEATLAQLRSQPLGVPLWCCIEIVVSKYKGADSILLHRDVNVTFWFRLVDYLNKPVDPVEAAEFLKGAPHVTAVNGDGERSSIDCSIQQEAIFEARPLTTDPSNSLETIFNRVSKVRKKEVPAEADAKSVERPSNKARKSQKRRHPSSDDKSGTASGTTSEETRGSTSSGSPSSSSKPRSKRKRRSHHHKRSHRHRDSKDKGREKSREHKRHGDVRRRPKKGEKDMSGQPENYSVAVEVPVTLQVVPVEKLHTCGPPFPYAPAAGLRVPKEEFIKQYIQPAVEERMRKAKEKRRKAKEKRRLTASATAARPKAIQTAQPPGLPGTHATQGRSTVKEGEVAVHDESSLNNSNRAAGTGTAPISYAQAVVDGAGQKKSSVPKDGESVSDYLSREFNVCIDGLESIFRNQLGKVKQLLIGKRVRSNPVHYPRGGVSFVVDDVSRAPPDQLLALHVPGPAPHSLATHFQQQGIELKHQSTWPCLVQRSERAWIKRRENARQTRNHASCYPLEVLQFDVADAEEMIGMR